MSKKNSIDDLFKTGISGFTIKPSDQVWQNVESGFFGKKGIALYKWYYMVAALFLLLLSAGSIWYFTSNKEITEPSANELINNQNEGVQPANQDAQTTDGLKNDVPNVNPDANMALSQEDLETTSEKVNIAESAQVSETHANKVKIDQNDYLHIAEEKSQQGIPTIEFHSLEKGIIESDIYVKPISGSIMPLNSRTIVFGNSDNSNMIDPKKVTGMQRYLEKQRKSHVYTGASFTAGMVYYPSTKDQFIWSADLTFGLTAGKFYFETGVSYQDMKERGIYAIELKSYDSVGYFNEVESFELNPQNPEEIIYNTKEVTVYDSLNHYTHTTPYFKYKYINVPLSVGFKFFNKDKFTAAVSTGVSLSMLIEKDIPDSDYYDPEYTVVRIKNMTPERVEWNMIWMISVRLNYKLYKSLSISAEPVFTKYLNSIYNTEKGYSNVKPYTMNLRVGLYYGF